MHLAGKVGKLQEIEMGMPRAENSLIFGMLQKCGERELK